MVMASVGVMSVAAVIAAVPVTIIWTPIVPVTISPVIIWVTVAVATAIGRSYDN
jgi:hypothetical protein